MNAPNWTCPAYRNPSQADVIVAQVALELAAQDGSYSARLLLNEINNGGNL